MSEMIIHIPEAGYGKKMVLKNISIRIKTEPPPIVAFIGPNGAGKSTLLKAIIGIVPVPNGQIQYQDLNLTGRSTEYCVKHGISFVPQGNRVFNELSVIENLEMGGYLIKDRSELKKQIESVIDIFPDLKDRLKQNAGTLSGGEKQQLAIARALILQPKVLLLDEPSLGLSPKLVTTSFEVIKHIRQSLNMMVLIVEQKVHEVFAIADEVYALKTGEIILSGKPDDMKDPEKLKSIFIV